MATLHFTKLSPNSNSKTLISQFNLSYSTTSLFPRTLTNLFSLKPKKDEEKTEPQFTKPDKIEKARTLARIINAGPWSNRIESSISALNPISQTTFFKTLRLIKTPSKALHFFKWAENSGFTHTHHSYFMTLEILGRARNLNTARNLLLTMVKKSSVPLTDKFFNSLIRSYGEAGLFQESLKVFEVMKSMGVSPSIITFNCLFMILVKKGRDTMVFELYNEMLRTYGVKPDLYTFNVLIKGFCMNLRVDEAFRVFKEMEKFDCVPDLVTYNTIVDGLCRAGKVNIAHNVFDGMLKRSENSKNSNLTPNVVTYTTLIRGYCGKREIDKALDVFNNMVDRGIDPNEITCNTIIRGLCDSQKTDKMKEILEKCHVGPDTCTFNTVMNFHCNKGNIDEALKVFEKMKELKVEQDSATYSSLICALCRKGNFDKAEKLLDELFEKEILLRDDGCTPLAAAYNPIFDYLCANGKTKKAERVFRQLMRRGIQDPPSYRTLIMGNCKEETFKNAHKLLVLMLRRDFLPDMDIYELLIDGLLRNEAPNLAFDTLKKMLRSSYLPTTSIFHRVLTELTNKGSAQDSANLVRIMLDKEIRPNINLSTDTIKVLFKNGLKNEAFELVKSLYENGYVVKMEELIVFLCEEKRFVQAGELVVFTLKNDQTVDLDLCSEVITGLCKCRKLSEAFQVYFELLEKGCKQPLTCLEELRTGLESGGKVKEAEFVAKRMIN